jgi:hypothetical protein
MSSPRRLVCRLGTARAWWLVLLLALCVGMATVPCTAAAARRTSASWTEHLYPAASPALSSIDFVDTSYGWAVGGAYDFDTSTSTGSILASVDGGGTWKAQHEPTGYTFQDVKFADRKHGWVTANSPILGGHRAKRGPAYSRRLHRERLHLGGARHRQHRVRAWRRLRGQQSRLGKHGPARPQLQRHRAGNDRRRRHLEQRGLGRGRQAMVHLLPQQEPRLGVRLRGRPAVPHHRRRRHLEAL